MCKATKIFKHFLLFFLFAEGLSQPMIRLPFNKKISIDDGLSSYNVKKIVQDQYGFIWIVTQDGLSRYDGRSFTIYNKSSMDAGHRLLGSDIWDIEEDSLSGMLWVVTAYGGLNAIYLKTGKVVFSIQAKVSNNGFNHEWLRCIKLYKNDLWIGTYDGFVVYNIVTKQFEPFQPIPFVKKDKDNFCIDKFFIDQNKNMWVFIANHGVALYSCINKHVVDQQSLGKLLLEKKSTFKQFNAIISISNDNLLIATNQGFRRLKYSRKGLMYCTAGLFKEDLKYNQTNIGALNIDAFGYVWFSTSSELFKADIGHHKIQRIKDANIYFQNDWFNYIYDILFDKENNIWLGTRKGVAYTKNTKPMFNPFYLSEDQATKIDHSFYLYPCSDSLIYACTESGLLKVNTVQNSIINLQKGKKFYFIGEHVDKNLLVSCEDSFFVYQPALGRFSGVPILYPELNPLRSTSINSITYANDSIAVVGTQSPNGFYVWNFKRKELTKFQISPKMDLTDANIVNTTYKDKLNRIWILGNKWIKIYNPSNNKFQSITLVNEKNQTKYNLFFDVCEAAGYFWVAAYGSGILQLNPDFSIKSFISAKNGLSNTGVYKIIPVNDSLLFITTNFGLSVINIHTQNISVYYKADGLNSNAFEQGCGILKNKKIYAGGIDGFTIIDPSFFNTNEMAPVLYLNNIKIETQSTYIDTANISLTKLEIPNDVLQVTLSFSALNYNNPLRTKYAYKIEDINTDWISLNTQNLISLIGLNSGKHTLLVTSANENNIWNDNPFKLDLIYLPKWYQTYWFKFAIVLLAILFVYTVYLYRIRQFKKQQRIRTDIATDLHDNIGGSLFSAQNSAHLAKKEPTKEVHFTQIEESITEAMEAFREMLWILNSNKDSVYDFKEYIKKIALSTSKVHKVLVECNIERDIYDEMLNANEKRNILLIVKESFNNSVKHAECERIKFSVTHINKKLTFLIEDDGKGFDKNIVSEGNGLKNIYYRAKNIGYKVDIITSEGKGASIKISKK